MPLGINVVSTNRGAASAVEPDDEVIGDYVASVTRLQALGDYVCLNLSCPNTRDGARLLRRTGAAAHAARPAR